MSYKGARKYSTQGQRSYSRSYYEDRRPPVAEELSQISRDEGTKKANEAWKKIFNLLVLVGKYPIGYIIKGSNYAVVDYTAWKDAWKSYKDHFIKVEEQANGLISLPFTWGARAINPNSMISINSQEFENWLWMFIVSNCTQSGDMINQICKHLQTKGLSEDLVEVWRTAIIEGEYPAEIPEKPGFIEIFLESGVGLTPGELSDDFSNQTPRYSNMLTEKGPEKIRTQIPGYSK